ncbi:AAA family ATPase [Maribacter sp. R77961]|uniref:AAA family ATPase n=1 Tax=Maribacter sp. R77961 TaxID=3093871 RepID=UPI0037C66A47
MNNIKISNFRKIQDTWDLDLAPITFFTGTNNSGKSTIFKALLIIEDYINSSNHFELDFNGENSRKHKIDCYDNALNRTYGTKNKDLIFNYSNYDFQIKFQFQPSEDKTNGKGKLVKLEVNREDNAKLIVYHTGGSNYQLEFDDILIERNNNHRDSEQRTEDQVLVRTIENLLNDAKQELENRKIFDKQIETRISEQKIKDNSTKSKNEINDGESIGFRLNKVLRELNISLDSAVDYLDSKGLNIEARPTAKIDLFTYKILKDKFDLDASDKAAIKNIRLKHLEKELKTNKQKIISLNQEISDSKKKLKIAIKKLESDNSIDKSINTYRPKFSLEDFHPSERTIGRIIRRVLPKYLRENDESIKLAGVGGGNAQAFRLGEIINFALLFSVDHLSPHRNNQTRLYINTNTSSDINELIKTNSTRPISKQSKAGKFLKEWMIKFDIGDDYRIKSIDGVATKIEIVEEGSWVNMVDKGFGAGQIFSILFKIALSIDDTKNNSRFRFTRNRKELIVIEEPEANLHPALQSKLADLFSAAFNEFGIRFIIETHSEYVIRQSQFLNLESPNLFGLYYFDKNEGPYAMNYMENGKFDRPFGSGFFNVADDLAVDMYKANLKKK